MKKHTWLWVGGIIVLLIIVWFASAGNRGGATDRPTSEIARACTTHEPGRLHIHPVLTIFIDGQQQEIPADVGITPDCMRTLHTHTPDGIIHIESAEPRDFTLGDFFANWEQPFGRDRILDHVADESHRIRMTVNGAEVDTFESTVLRDHDQIVIYYETI